MKNKILKIATIMLLLATLTMTNFIYVGVGLVSYAASSTATNHQNVEFSADLKENHILSLMVSVKKDGYFNGEITLENSNFKLKSSESEFIHEMQDNKIVLNQLNAGTTAKIEMEIEPVKDEIFNAGLLTMESEINLTGKYQDSTEKNNNIKASRKIKMDYVENNESKNVENTIQVVTNKIAKIAGEEKRVVQLEMNMGLKENNYPIKTIHTKLNIPSIDGKSPTIVKKVDFNTMTHWDYQYDGTTAEFNFTNLPNEQNNILWRKTGNEKVIVTLIYDKEVNVEKLEMQAEENVTLYNNKELSAKNQIIFGSETKDSIIQINASNTENTIYKGKLYAGLDRQYESKTMVAINLANTEENVTVKEEATTYKVNDTQVDANVVYNQTKIKKESFDNVFGENGMITIINEKGETIGTIDNATPVNEAGEIVLDYTGKEPKTIEIKMSTPVLEGNLEFVHTKTIKAQETEIVKNATDLYTKVTYASMAGEPKTAEATTKLEESVTQATLEVNKDSLSTIIDNHVEMKATLKADHEKYNLYKNPTITITMPEEVEGITINSADLMYESELKIKEYHVDGRNIVIQLEGQQTNYKEASIPGSMIVVNATVQVNRKAATKDGQIVMTYANEGVTGTDRKPMRVVAPKDVTLIHSIENLEVETMGQEESKVITLSRGAEAKQLQTGIEIINNHESAIENVKVLGKFPTKSKENNMDIAITKGIQLEGIEGAKVYYTENEAADSDLQKTENGWSETLTNPSQVKKYLIEVPNMASQASIKGTYQVQVPALLEYNQVAKQGYEVTYTNQTTKVEGNMKATTLSFETGVGPKIETKLTAEVGGKEVSNATVRNGEVIKYKVEVSNVGSEDLKDVTVQGNVPEGTTLVKPQEYYEYTGSSYYQELQDKTYEDKIESLKVGEVVAKEYEVRVNSNTAEGTKLTNQSQVKYGDVIKKTEGSSLTVSKGTLRVTVKRITDRNVDLYETGNIQYYAIIENISGQKQDNITVKTNLPELLEVYSVSLITGMEAEEVTRDDLYIEGEDTTEIPDSELSDEEPETVTEESKMTTEELEYKDELNIGSLEAGENKVLAYSTFINKVDKNKQIDFSVTAMNGTEEYKSNAAVDHVRKAEIALEMTTNTEGKYVKAGDILQYTITVKNNGTDDIEGLVIKDTIPNSLSINQVTFDGEKVEELEDMNDIEISCNIGANSQSTIVIETVVNQSDARDEAEAITNVAYAELLSERIATTSEISHIIEADSENGNNGENGNGNNQVEDNDIATGNRMITGIAWFDENADGKKDDNEKLLNNVKVHLLNTQTNHLVKDKNGKVLEAITNENGLYVLNNIGNGKYIVVFEYDNSQYSLTKYKVAGVEESKNSDAMLNELTIEEGKQQVAATDIIEITNENISDINIGLIKLQNFDLKLDKYVSKIVIQNSAGTTVREYTDETVAKAELDAKKINGSTVIVEYQIKVSNVGEIDGYAKKIVDYMPNDFKFSSELNKDWYQTGDALYNASLANDKIAAGESKVLTLTLTKAMTENNAGRSNNTAEIAESYNELGIADSNSTPGNRAQGENDMGSADVILSIRTGGAVYIGITIVMAAILGIVAYIIIVKNRQDDIDLKI